MNSSSDLLFGELDLAENSFVSCSVRQPVIQNSNCKPGDIDLLICDEGQPNLAVGIQCRRVKVMALNQAEDRYNKLESVADGVEQANLQRENLRFHQNYLMVVIQTYGRYRAQNNVAFRGPSDRTWSDLYEFPWRRRLDSDVGIIFVQINQPTGKTFNSMYEVGVCVDKSAARLDQQSGLTDRIAQLIRHTSRYH